VGLLCAVLVIVSLCLAVLLMVADPGKLLPWAGWA